MGRKMSVFGWIRDFIGIRKDAIETKKAKLEVNRLQDEQRERESIKRADLEDVKKYDPKTKKLLRKIEELEKQKVLKCQLQSKLNICSLLLVIIFKIVLLVIIIILFIYLISKLS